MLLIDHYCCFLIPCNCRNAYGAGRTHISRRTTWGLIIKKIPASPRQLRPEGPALKERMIRSTGHRVPRRATGSHELHRILELRNAARSSNLEERATRTPHQDRRQQKTTPRDRATRSPRRRRMRALTAMSRRRGATAPSNPVTAPQIEWKGAGASRFRAAPTRKSP